LIHTIDLQGGASLVLHTFEPAVAPRGIGVPRIGHFGFFRPQFEATLWPLVAQWLRG
jgi:predicted alpha/beta hydrolase